MKRNKGNLLLSITALTAMIASVEAREPDSPFWIQAEIAPVWQSRNEVQIPAQGGSRFSLAELDRGPAFSYRAYIGYRINEEQEVRGLFAPLTLNLKARFRNPVSYQSQSFLNDRDIDATYRFNSYRLTYRYRFVHSENFSLRAGLTGKIRDAEIRLKQESVSASRSNVGFVPLLHLQADHALTERLSVSLDLDGLWSPYGRAEDIALFGVYRALDELEIIAGYRTVEGGADGRGDVYNFAWLHYATLGARLSL